MFGFKADFFNLDDDFIEDPKVKSWIDADLRHLEKELGKFERVKSFCVKRNPFSLEAGELTPTQKAKRKFIMEKYSQQIKDMYVNIVE